MCVLGRLRLFFVHKTQVQFGHLLFNPVLQIRWIWCWVWLMAEGPDRLRFLQGRQSLNCALLSVVVTNTVVDLLNQTDLINFIVV